MRTDKLGQGEAVTTSTTKHTTGPWVVGTMGHDTDIETQAALLIEDKDTEREWAPIGINDDDGFAEVIALAHPANARLIAAAPELLSALVDLLDACPVSCEDSRLIDAQRTAEAAIAKAEGKATR